MEEIRHRRRVLMIPAPFEGHLPSMMNLASSLSSKGFSITILRTQYNFYDISSNFPDLSFLTIDDGFSDSDMKSLGLLEFILELNSICEPLFKQFLTDLHDDDDDDVDLIIYDEFVYFPRCVAEDLNLPKMIFSSSSAATSISRCVLMDLQRNGLLPTQLRSSLEETVPEFNPFRFKDLPVTAYGSMERLLLLYENVSNRAQSSAIIHNSSNCLESSFISTAQHKWKVPIYALGPLHMTNSTTSSCPSLFEEERNCIDWLDKQETNSVLYISMGSLAITQENEAVEMSMGLVQSNQRFLWVIRPGSITGYESIDSLPEQFRQRVNEGKGFVVKWAPQKEVLRHRAVGGFWNHCGWNSSLESISCGVPMICRPYSGDQRVNARLMSYVWRTTFEVEGELERGMVEIAVRRIIQDQEGEEMRMRAIKLKEEVEASVRFGGSSHSSLNRLVDKIMSLTS